MVLLFGSFIVLVSRLECVLSASEDIRPHRQLIRRQEGNQVRVVVVMYDQTYSHLMDCFMHYFGAHQTKPKLDIIVYDNASESHASKIKSEYPESVRSVQLVEEFKYKMLDSSVSRRWPSTVYIAHFWQAIQERLLKGEQVLHLDLDAIPVGDPFGPVDKAPEFVDMVTPLDGSEPGAQYMFFRNTRPVLDVVDAMVEEWKSAFQSKQLEGGPPPDQKALHRYFSKYNPQGCLIQSDSGHALRKCQTQAGSIVLAAAAGVDQDGACEYPYECEQKQIYICHGRAGMTLRLYCTKKGYNVDDAINHP